MTYAKTTIYLAASAVALLAVGAIALKPCGKNGTGLATMADQAAANSQIPEPGLSRYSGDCKKTKGLDPPHYDCSDKASLAAAYRLAAAGLLHWHGQSRELRVSMYTSRPEETDDSPCIAANNQDICRLHDMGQSTCASNDYPLGTRLRVSGLGDCVVRDRMNARYTGTGRLDWYGGRGTSKNISIARRHGVQDLLATELIEL